MKTKVYNVIILDKSGSMSSIARQAVDGVNETIGSIKSAQEKNPDQEHNVTLVAFCGCEMKMIYDDLPVAEVKTLTDRDYSPCCMTPLYDAIGTTITRVHALKSQQPDSLALVTIITDGYENASHEFTRMAIMSLIDSYKEQGWQFTDKSEAGTVAMFAKERKARSKWVDEMADVMAKPCASHEERLQLIRNVNKEDFFDDEEY